MLDISEQSFGGRGGRIFCGIRALLYYRVGVLRALGRVGRGRLEFVSGRDEPDVLALSIIAVPRLRSELEGRHGHRSRKETHDGPLQHRGSWLFSANKQRLVLIVSDPT